MKKSEINQKFREYAKTLSPKPEEQNLIKGIYKSFNDLFGEKNCLPIGSFPRFTSITPIHDFDLLYILGPWNERDHSPTSALEALFDKIKSEYENPTSYNYQTSFQTHSITVSYLDGDQVRISVDIVPAYICFKNEFDQNTYMIPEVVKSKGVEQRQKYYNDLRLENKEMGWINSDPKGYIKIASDIDSSTSGEFRKSVKLVKRWKHNLKEIVPELKLKSFHLEQVVTKYFESDQSLSIYDAIFKFFIELPDILENPNQIPDRARNDKYIDDYLEHISDEQKERIKEARDGFLIKLESISEEDTIGDLLIVVFRRRQDITEEYLFDSSAPIPILTHEVITICGEIQQKSGVNRLLSALGFIDNGQHIKFRISCGCDANSYKWKVKNDDEAEKPRGEITDHHTLNDPERTQYPGTHYVECYAIKDGICVAKAKQYVRLK